MTTDHSPTFFVFVLFFFVFFVFSYFCFIGFFFFFAFFFLVFFFVCSPLSFPLSLWELSCAGFRHLAGFHARVSLDGAACPLGELGDVHDVLGVLGVDRVVPVVLRVLVSWLKEE